MQEKKNPIIVPVLNFLIVVDTFLEVSHLNWFLFFFFWGDISSFLSSMSFMRLSDWQWIMNFYFWCLNWTVAPFFRKSLVWFHRRSMASPITRKRRKMYGKYWTRGIHAMPTLSVDAAASPRTHQVHSSRTYWEILGWFSRGSVNTLQTHCRRFWCEPGWGIHTP